MAVAGFVGPPLLNERGRRAAAERR